MGVPNRRRRRYCRLLLHNVCVSYSERRRFLQINTELEWTGLCAGVCMWNNNKSVRVAGHMKVVTVARKLGQNWAEINDQNRDCDRDGADG